ncbi:MAG TPA: hypothetical protein VG753_02095 [Candidatus Paceibacterota bacterium]|nr:hypothetical protein [Candidatus Paceibacterota bacterium]
MPNFRVKMRGHFNLMPGAQLLFDPEFPPGYEEHGHFSVDSDGQELLEIKEKYQGAIANFIEWGTELIGPLDNNGRWPGTYINPRVVRVQFPDKREIALYTKDFIVLPGIATLVLGSGKEDLRLGDLPFEMKFWDGDMVQLKPDKRDANHFVTLTDAPRKLEVLFVERTGSTSYWVHETKEELIARRVKDPTSFALLARATPEEGDFILVERGNLWALYHDPAELKFVSDDEEFEFWMQDGIRRVPRGKRKPPIVYESVDQALKAGEDLVEFHLGDDSDDHDWYVGFKLHECFGVHRERVRALIKRKYATEVVA